MSPLKYRKGSHTPIGHQSLVGASPQGSEWPWRGVRREMHKIRWGRRDGVPGFVLTEVTWCEEVPSVRENLQRKDADGWQEASINRQRQVRENGLPERVSVCAGRMRRSRQDRTLALKWKTFLVVQWLDPGSGASVLVSVPWPLYTRLLD